MDIELFDLQTYRLVKGYFTPYEELICQQWSKFFMY